jgi:hypothetical protein
MTYELAKQLKDAGFPFNWGVNGDTMLYDDFPSLSELIEACGDKFVLHSPKSKDINEEYYTPSETEWTAYSQTERFGTIIYKGSTPEEAVANLWLKLNEK